MGDDACTQQLGAPRSGAPSRSVRALSPIVRRPFWGGSEGGPVASVEGVRPCPRGDSPIVAQPAHRLEP
eukprot:4883500-Alexandrium_andersonii.AAC.1